MKHIVAIVLVSGLALLSLTTSSRAADNWNEFPAAEAIHGSLGQEKLMPTIQLFMKGQSHPAVSKTFGEFKTNKRSNKFGKSIEGACDVAFVSALISLQERAVREGGNAVIDIYSVTKDEDYENPEKYRCISGFAVANVALKGTVASLGP